MGRRLEVTPRAIAPQHAHRSALLLAAAVTLASATAVVACSSDAQLPAEPNAPGRTTRALPDASYARAEMAGDEQPWLATPLEEDLSAIQTLFDLEQQRRESGGAGADAAGVRQPLYIAYSTWRVALDLERPPEARAEALLSRLRPTAAVGGIPLASHTSNRDGNDSEAEERAAGARLRHVREFARALNAVDTDLDLTTPGWRAATIDYDTFVTLVSRVQQGWILRLGLADLPERLHAGATIALISRLLPPAPMLIAVVRRSPTTGHHVLALDLAIRPPPMPPEPLGTPDPLEEDDASDQ